MTEKYRIDKEAIRNAVIEALNQVVVAKVISNRRAADGDVLDD